MIHKSLVVMLALIIMCIQKTICTKYAREILNTVVFRKGQKSKQIPDTLKIFHTSFFICNKNDVRYEYKLVERPSEWTTNQMTEGKWVDVKNLKVVAAGEIGSGNTKKVIIDLDSQSITHSHYTYFLVKREKLGKDKKRKKLQQKLSKEGWRYVCPVFIDMSGEDPESCALIKELKVGQFGDGKVRIIRTSMYDKGIQHIPRLSSQTQHIKNGMVYFNTQEYDHFSSQDYGNIYYYIREYDVAKNLNWVPQTDQMAVWIIKYVKYVQVDGDYYYNSAFLIRNYFDPNVYLGYDTNQRRLVAVEPKSHFTEVWSILPINVYWARPLGGDNTYESISISNHVYWL